MTMRDVLQNMQRGLAELEFETGWNLGLERVANQRDVDALPVETQQDPRLVSFELAPLRDAEDVRDHRLREFLIRRDRLLLPNIEKLISVEDENFPEGMAFWMGALTRSAQEGLMSNDRYSQWTRFASKAMASVCVSDILVGTRGPIASFETPHVGRARSHFSTLAGRLLDRPIAQSVRESIEELLSELSESGLVVSYEERPVRPESSEKLTVIVHGTFAAGEKWWRDPAGISGKYNPNENLWNYLQAQGVSDLAGYGREFAWSGGHTTSDRWDGARDFLRWWFTHGTPRLDVVAHSHGGNVVMLAQMLEPKLKVETLVMLGTPASFEYVPRLRQVGKLHNLYSRHDGVQVFGAWISSKRGEGRTQCDNLQVTNWHLAHLAKGSTAVTAKHGDLHHPDFWKAHDLVSSFQL
jgi:pimeloyl-ACP methyl ester carboxylesterase